MEIGRYDPVNMNIDQCKELFLEYKETKDAKLFELLLLKYDRFIIYSLHKFKKSHYCLADEDIQDLYQISILGFYKAILSVKPHHRVDKLNFRISSYIKRELRLAYDYKKKKFKGKIIWDQDPLDQFNRNLKSISMNVMISTMDLTEKERQILRLRFIENKTYKEIGKAFSMSIMGASKCLAKILEKMRVKLNKEKKSLLSD